MYAIIETGGKQYKVAEGEKLKVELLPMEEGATLDLDQVLAVQTDDGFKAGAPYVEGAKVSCKVLGHGKHKKVIVVHYKPKKNIHTKNGHRQPYTEIQVEKITF